MNESGFCKCGCGKKTRVYMSSDKTRGRVKGAHCDYIFGHIGHLLKGTKYEREPIEIRFWRYVEKTSSCWIWKGAKQPFGYGVILFRKKYVGAHRVSWILNEGEIPEGLSVLHHCDTPACVNPRHLFLGTQKDNIRDGIAKGRIRLLNLKRGATFVSLNA